MREITLSPSLFAILASLVEERTGIHYAPRDNELFSSKLVTHALDAGFESPLDYYYFLRYDDRDGRAFDALVESLVVNETYFFREVEPLRTLCDEILRPAIAAGRRPRVWCAAASTGEEPLTLAMLLDERALLPRVDIVASDISARVLARAREGVYGTRALRGMPAAAKARWTTPGAGDSVVVPPTLRDAITWLRLNLLDTDAIAALGAFDVILCRNVLIYFDDPTVSRVATTLTGSLRDGGRLVIGASESLLRLGTMLTCEELGGSFFYRKDAR